MTNRHQTWTLSFFQIRTFQCQDFSAQGLLCARTFWRHEFPSPEFLAPGPFSTRTLQRQVFSAPGPFGARTFWRQHFGAKNFRHLSFLALGDFGAKTLCRQDI